MNNCAIDNLTLYTLHVAASVGRDPFAFVSSISPFPLFFLLIALPSPPLDICGNDTEQKKLCNSPYRR